LVISAPELGLVLDVLADRSKESLENWLQQRGPAWCAQVETCCADMWDAYHTVAKALLPQAQRVVDRFHVMKNLTDAITKARRTIQRQADEDTQALLKGGRWLLVKNRENLTEDEATQLTQMLAISPELKTCYDLKEDLRSWFAQSADRETAANGLVEWQIKAKATGLRSLQAFAKTLDNWRESILNYFNGRYSNGFAEGVNLKIKMLHRRGFGYRNFEHFRLHVLVAFGSLPR
jgi:transposase